MPFFKKRLIILFATMGLAISPTAFAKDNFSDGSFGDDNAGGKPTKPSSDVVDNLDGSFDEKEPGQIPAQNPTETTKPDDGFIEGGSFVENEDTPIVVKPKPIKKVEPEPVKPVKPAKPHDPILAYEMRDFGVRPVKVLRRQQMHAPTPTAIPSGRLISTAQLFQAYKSNQQMVVIDVLGGSYTLPGSHVEQRVAYGGNYNDRIQQQTAAWLHQLSDGNRSVAIVMFCSDPMCWLSYNASLRAINAGFKNVFWYRGGKTAWQMAGHQMVPTGF